MLNFSKRFIHNATKQGQYTVLKNIIKQDRSSVNKRDIDSCYPLHYASKYNIVKLLIDVNVQNNRLDTPLHITVKNNDKDTVNLLSNNRANKHYMNIRKIRPLYIAIKYNRRGIAKRIRSKGDRFYDYISHVSDEFSIIIFYLIFTLFMLYITCETENNRQKRVQYILCEECEGCKCLDCMSDRAIYYNK